MKANKAKNLLPDPMPMENGVCPSRADFTFELRLGSGAFGQVWRVRHKTTQESYALKQVAKASIEHLHDQFRREVTIMYHLSHPNIIKLYSHFEDQKYCYLLLELAENGSLFQRLLAEKAFTERTAFQYFSEILSGIEHLHSRTPMIIHRDLKPENILIDKNGHLKLTDFGWSNYYSQELRVPRFTLCGTYEYFPPEMVDEVGHTPAVDVWCLGILLYEMLCGRTPFANTATEKMMFDISYNNVRFPEKFPELAKDLIVRLTEKIPAKRIALGEIKKQKWFIKFSGEFNAAFENGSGDFNGDSLSGREIGNKVRRDIEEARRQSRELKERLIIANKEAREKCLATMRTEQMILKKRVETLDVEHSIQELERELWGIDKQIEELMPNGDLQSISADLDQLRNELLEKKKKISDSQLYIISLGADIEILDTKFSEYENHLLSSQNYLQNLKVKGLKFHQRKNSKLIILQNSCDLLKRESDKIQSEKSFIELPDENESKDILKFMVHIEGTLQLQLGLEEKIKCVEDLIKIKESEVNKLQKYYMAERKQIRKSYRTRKEFIYHRSLDSSAQKSLQNYNLVKEQLKEQIRLSNNLAHEFSKESAEFNLLSLEVARLKKTINTFDLSIQNTRNIRKHLKRQIRQNKKFLKQISLEKQSI